MRKLVPALCALAVLGLAGCGGNKAIKETGYSGKPLRDRQGHKLKSADAKKLYDSARDFLANDQPKKALRLYAQIQAQFPFSPYGAQSQLETVTAHYKARQYRSAIDTADHFIKQHPRNPHIDYVYYMRGLSNFNRNKPNFFTGDPDNRGTGSLEQAFSDFSILVNNYPDSVYAKDAQLHMINIRNRLAKFDLGVAEYYLRRHAYVAASRRAERVIGRYQGSGSVPRALEIMEQSYAKLGLADLAQDARAMLQASYPNYILHRNEFYRQAAGEKPHYKLPAMGGGRSDGGAATGKKKSDSPGRPQPRRHAG